MKKAVFLVASCLLLTCSGCVAPLLIRLYYLEGGKNIWLTTFLQSCGFPITLIALLISYFCRRTTEGPNTKPAFMTVPTFIGSLFLGLLIGFINFFYAFAMNGLPVSTITLIVAAQLAFTAFFSFLIVKQKFTVFSIAAVVLLVSGAACLAIGAGNDKPQGDTVKQYIIAFIMAIVCTALIGLTLPLMQLVYTKAKQEMSYILTMEMQMMMMLFATVIPTIAMLVNHSFKEIPVEAANFRLGEEKYYLVIVWIAILSQVGFLGNIGVVTFGSALFGGILASFLVPVTEILAVIFLHEKFNLGKGLSLAFCLVGLAVYYYGEIKRSKKSDLGNDEASQMLLEDNVPASI